MPSFPSSMTVSTSTTTTLSPVFPDTVPTAPLVRISLAKLLSSSGDGCAKEKKEEEAQKLWEACCELGFFYLDLRDVAQDLVEGASEDGSRRHGATKGHASGQATNGGDAGNADACEGGKDEVNGERLLADANALFDVAAEFFELDVLEKIKYDFAAEGSYFGYKGYGSGIIDPKGTKDRNEFYNVSKDDILGLSPQLPAPALFTKHRPLLESYIRGSHSLITFILGLLIPRLGLPDGKLESLHRLTATSGDQVRFVHAPPQPAEDRRTALGAHTDFGSVTVLFNRLGGLQVRLPAHISPVPPPRTPGISSDEIALTQENWAYVRPLPGHAVINLGDAMVKFSAGILRSNTHRVVAPPGAQADCTRYSLVYFGRPEDDVKLVALRESEMIRSQAGDDAEDKEALSSKEWILRRALGRRTGAKGFDYAGSGGTEEARGSRG